MYGYFVLLQNVYEHKFVGLCHFIYPALSGRKTLPIQTNPRRCLGLNLTGLSARFTNTFTPRSGNLTQPRYRTIKSCGSGAKKIIVFALRVS